jgi:hypothetical protein
MMKKIFSIILLVSILSILNPVYKGAEYQTKSLSVDNNIISMIQELDESLYLGYLENLTDIGPRVTGTDNCLEAGEYIYNEFKKMNLDVRYHNWSNSGFYGSNIEATIQGLDSNNDEIYVICAHYDTVSRTPGADDDGSGTVAVMASAKVMSTYTFNHTIRFVAFSGEEQGLLGSKAYAEEAYNKGENIIALNLDMIGYSKNVNDKILIYYNTNEDEFKWLYDYTDQISKTYSEYIEMETIPSGSSGGSDHASFWAWGYNSIFYSEYEWNPNYHTAGDTIGNMDVYYATEVSKLSLATLAELSEVTENTPPEKPETPTGEINGEIQTLYEYSTLTNDMHLNKIYYLWDWGDGNFSEWLGPYNSGEECIAKKTWTEQGDYEIKVKAKDEYGLESSWSDSLTITMPYKKNIDGNLIEYILNRFFILSQKIKIFQ